MNDPSEIRYAKIQEKLEPCVTELNTKNKTVKVDWYIPIEFCHTKGTIAHGGTVSFILDASMFFVIDLIHKGFTTGLTLGLNIQYLNPCQPGKVTTEASILREGKNFAFTQCHLIQNDITVSSGTQQMSLYHNKVAQDSSWFTPKPYKVID